MSTAIAAGILKDLTNKNGSFTRCYNEYGTYCDELKRDQKMLDDFKAQGKETKQQEQVVQETAAMLPITAKNAKKVVSGLSEYWKAKKSIFNGSLPSMEPKDREKTLKDLGSICRAITRVMDKIPNDKTKQRCPLDDSDIALVREILKDWEELGVHPNEE